jgi:serine/threonine protein kinase
LRRGVRLDLVANGLDSWASSKEERAFLQRRVVLGCLVAGSSFAVFWIYRTITLLLFATPAHLSEPSYLIHLAASLTFFAISATARWAPLGAQGLRRLEAGGFFVASILVCLMGYYIPVSARPDLIVLLGLTYSLMARSTMIPSSGPRTAGLSLAVGAVMLTFNYVHCLEIDLDKWKAFEPGMVQDTVESFALWVTVTQGVWWLLSSAVAIASSHVIYGLRRSVRDALQLGQYRLDSKIGEGGMGEVYRAHHALLRRPTAIKLLRPDQTGEASLRRFESEVQLTAKLTHPNTVTIFDYGRTADGVFYYAMEFLDGVDLDRLVSVAGPQDQARVRHILLQVAAALVHAHGVGLIHRDIKPGNIMVTLPHRFGGTNDLVKLLDFGLVKEIDAGGSVHLTQRNTITGTPQYLSPEAIRSPDSVDGRSDLYAVGAVAYFLLTGRPVFDGPSIVEVCSQHLHTPPEPISKHRSLPLSSTLEQIILDCLAKDRADRPASALVLQQRLAACEDAGRWTSEDALRWWDVHLTDLERKPTAVPSPVELTIDALRARQLAPR